MTSSIDFRKLCQDWETENGKLDSKNFITAIIDIAFPADTHQEDIIKEILETADIKNCIGCGRIPATPKAVNGDIFCLCSCCKESVLFQDLGPQEGYT